MIYQLLLTIGGLGLTAQIVLGFSHGGGHGGHSGAQGHGGGHAGHASSHHGGHAAGHHATTTHGHGGHSDANHSGQGSHTHDNQGDRGSAALNVNFSLALWLSPLNLFSIALGSGATGLALQPLHFGDLFTGLLAALGGVMLLILVVRPVWSLIMRFVSAPAEALAGVVAREGVAVSRFDAQGRGVVRVSVDGQTVRLLGRLDKDEHGTSTAISPGDRLLVTGIDGVRNQCRVTKL